MRGLTTSIDATTNIPSVVERAKASFVSFDKQIADIGKKFSTGFKDIFLGFFAPMAIFNTVMGLITDKIATAQQKAQDGLTMLAEAEEKGTKGITTEESRVALFFKRRAEMKKEAELIEAGKMQLARDVLTDSKKFSFLQLGILRTSMMTPEFADFVFKELQKTPQGQQIIKETLPEKKADTFKTPEGFSNVVGVGPSPVMEAMAAQLEEAQKQTALLEKIAGGDAATGWMNKDSK